MPCIVLDMPHVWTAWSRRVAASADEIVIVATPDLACLRNAKNLIDTFKPSRHNDAPPRLVLNMVGVPKRPEIKAADFAKALETEPVAEFPFDPAIFGTAANNGQMISETNATCQAGRDVPRHLAQIVTGRPRYARQAQHLKPIISKSCSARRRERDIGRRE